MASVWSDSGARAECHGEIIKTPTWNDLHRNEHSFYARGLISTRINMHNAHYCIIKLHHLSVAQWDSRHHKSTNQAAHTASDSVILLLIFNIKLCCAIFLWYFVFVDANANERHGKRKIGNMVLRSLNVNLFAFVFVHTNVHVGL